MPADRAILGSLTAEMLDWLDEGDGPDVEILTAMVIVETVDDKGFTRIGFKCSDHRQWFQEAFMEQALNVASIDESDDEDDD